MLKFVYWIIVVRAVLNHKYELDWGIFPLVEFVLSNRDNIGKKYKNCLDIGSGAGIHSQIFTDIGLKTSQIDKYSSTSNIKDDFMDYCFNETFDIIYCSHVIEHQRNIGNFLDKIFDLLTVDGKLLIAVPKHDGNVMIEGHINSFLTPLFIQQLVYAGFDLKNGKYLSCGLIENAAIVSKAINFNISERQESGYEWTKLHQERSFINLKNQMFNEKTFFHGCEHLSSNDGKSIHISNPENYKSYGINIISKRFGLDINI